jgi:hypothetical protein
MPHPAPNDEPPLDARTEAMLKAKMAAIKRQTDASWSEVGFFAWLFQRLTLTSRREKR